MDNFVSLLGLSSMILAPISLIIAIIYLVRKKNAKKWFVAMGVSVITFVICLYIPTCSHEWLEATCIRPKTCILCGETDGELKEQHDWNNATCEKPRMCNDCAEIDGVALGHTKGEWIAVGEGVREIHCNICNEVLERKSGFAENIYKVADIPDNLMNEELKSIIDLFSRGFSQSGLDISDATTYNEEGPYFFYFDGIEFLGEEPEDGYFRPYVKYSQDAIKNNGIPDMIYFAFSYPRKSNGYKETVAMVKDIANTLNISYVGLIDNDYSSSSKWATGEYTAFTFPNLNLKLTVSNMQSSVEIEIVKCHDLLVSTTSENITSQYTDDTKEDSSVQHNDEVSGDTITLADAEMAFEDVLTKYGTVVKDCGDLLKYANQTNFATDEQIYTYSNQWQDLANSANVLAYKLEQENPPAECEAEWNALAEKLRQVGSILYKASILDWNYDGKYESDEMETVLHTARKELVAGGEEIVQIAEVLLDNMDGDAVDTQCITLGETITELKNLLEALGEST